MRSDRVLLAAVILAALLIGMKPVPAQEQEGSDAAKAAAQQREEHEKDFEDGDKGEGGAYIRKRQQWFHDQRAYPLKHIPAGIRQRAIKVRDRKIAAEAAARMGISNGAGSRILPQGSSSPQWTPIGPQPVGNYYGVSAGRVTSLAVNPTNPSIVYAGGAEGGIWKTTNGGANWTSLTDSQPSLAVGSIALDPTNSNTIYVGTGEENFSGDSYYGAGVLKSTDGGNTWTQYCGPFCGPENVNGYADPGAYIGSIAVDPNNNQIVLAAVELYGAHGVYRSTNGGSTWTLVSTDGGIANIVLFDPVNVGIAYAASETAGILKSTNHGQTWTGVNGSGATALPALNGGRIALAIAPSSPSTLYVGITNNETSGLLGFYKTTDGAATWNQLTGITNYCGTQCWYDNIIGVSPVNANVIFAGGSYAYSPGNSAALRSLDGGATWADQGPVHPDAHAMAFSADGAILYTGNDGGVWSTSNPSAATIAWTSLNPTLALTEFYAGLSIDPNDVNRSYGGTQDNGTNKYSGGLDWPTVDCGDGGSTAIDFNTPTTAYTTCVGLSVDKTTNDGSSFTSMISGISSSDRLPFIPTLSMDPENPKTLYFGTYRVYQTTNGASSWNAISPDLTKNDGYDTVVVMTVAPKDSNTVYAGSTEGVLSVTRNAMSGTQATWATLSGTASLPNRSITSIAVDPATAATAYVGYSGFTGYGDSLGHIFMTTNAGTTWTDISSDLPNTPVDAILVDPDSPQTIFIGTDIGAFYTSNKGASWSALGVGLPNIVVTGLALHENSRTLRASTHGRSVWDLNISTLLPVPSIYNISPASVPEGNPQFTLIVNGVQFASNSVVEFNGTALQTTYVNAGQLTAIVPAADVNLPGTANITVSNPSSSTLSNTAALTITYIASTTTTTLTVSPASGALRTVFTLKASVTDRSGAEMKGSVSFYNGTALLATVQVITKTDALGTTGTAEYKTSGLLVGSNSITAVWNPTTLDSTSTSSPQTVMVTGQYPTATTLTSTGSQGSYILNAAIAAAGAGTPTGTVTFTDTSTQSNLGTVNIASLKGGLSYTPQTPLIIGSEPNQTALADLNGDGYPDMVTASYNGSTNWLSVALGNGDGTFKAQTPVATGANSNNGGNSVVIADVNGDGIPDILAGSYSGVGLAVFLGNGDGTFGAETDFPLDSSYAFSIAVGDFNGDGYLDVVTADYFGSTISVLLGNGDGTFQAETPYATDTNPSAVAVGDVNGDGKLDIAVANTTGNVSLFLGNGDGTFKAQTLILGSPNADYYGPSGIAIGDVNGDGKPDIALAVYGADEVAIIPGNGDGTFKTATGVSALSGVTPDGVVIADINRDGIADMVVSSIYGNAVTVLLGTGGGNFTATQYPAGSGGQSIAVKDLNGDGILDLVAPNQNDGTVSELLGSVSYGASISGVTLPGLTTDNVNATYSGDTRFLSSVSNTLSLASNASSAATPTFSPAAGTYSAPQSVKISDTIAGSTIYYTTTGATPTTSSAKYAGAINVSSSETLKAVAVATGYAQSAVASAAYTISYGVTVTPGSYGFASTVVGSTSTSTAITLQNTSSIAVTGIAFSIIGTNPSSFSLPSSAMLCGTTLAAGASCSFSVAFTPTATGALSATVSITDSSSSSPQVVTVSGTGIANAPVISFDGIGSSSLFLALGQAAASATTGSPAGLGATCLWTTRTSGVVTATDSSTNGAGKTDSGSAWVAWTPVGGSCSTTNATTVVYAYLATDSVVGNRCLFNGCTVKYGGSGSASAGLINGASEVPLAAGVAAALNGAGGAGLGVTAAGTDIRPEDAEFATARALTPCGAAVASGSQYLGLGYANGGAVKSYYSGAAFNVINFALPSAYTVTPIGAAPLVVVVNGQGSNNGFSDPGITNVTSGALASFLDGTFAQTQDALTSAATGATEPITVLVREPLSGAYNVMEFGVVNTQSLKSSQDVGLSQQAAQLNCNGTAVKSNPLSISSGAGYRRRAIGTAEELSEVLTRANSLGYAFWSAENFKAFTATGAPNAKYLTVDGVDPLQPNYSGGAVPTTPAQLANVTLQNVANGSYPIWSNLRLVNVGAAATPAVTSLTTAAQNFASGSAQPDFVPFNSLYAVHSHFIPPAGTGLPATPSNGSAHACSKTETGGDVGGVVLTKAGDYDYCYDFGLTTGRTGLRR